MTDDLVLSSSSVSAYAECHWRYYLMHVERLPAEQNLKAAVGLGVHVAAERFYKAKREGIELPLADALETFDLTYWLEAAASGPDDDLPDPDKAAAIGRRVTQSYIEDVASGINPVLVEYAGIIEVNDIPFSGQLDLSDDKDVVHDTKVKKQKPRDPGMYADQLNGYALLFRAATGRIETDVVLDIMIRLKRDRPYHVPISNGGPVTRTAIGLFAARLERVANGIARSDFEPTGLATGACRFCPYQSVCEPYAEMTRKEIDDARTEADDTSWAFQHGNDSGGHEHWGLD